MRGLFVFFKRGGDIEQGGGGCRLAPAAPAMFGPREWKMSIFHANNGNIFALMFHSCTFIKALERPSVFPVPLCTGGCTSAPPLMFDGGLRRCLCLPAASLG